MPESSIGAWLLSHKEYNPHRRQSLSIQKSLNSSNQPSTQEAAMTHTDPSGEQLHLEEEKLKIENEKLKIENEKLEVEKTKNRWTARSIFASIVVASIAYFSAQTAQSQAANDVFQLKVAEMVMSGTAHDAQNKMIALKILFPEHTYLSDVKLGHQELTHDREK